MPMTDKQIEALLIQLEEMGQSAHWHAARADDELGRAAHRNIALGVEQAAEVIREHAGIAEGEYA